MLKYVLFFRHSHSLHMHIHHELFELQHYSKDIRHLAPLTFQPTEGNCCSYYHNTPVSIKITVLLLS